jgi:hypothetical protein
VNLFSLGVHYLPCPAGKKVVGGGVRTSHSIVQSSYPDPFGNGWQAVVFNDDGFVDGDTMTMYAVCVNA